MRTRWITLGLFAVIFLVSCGTDDSDLAEGGSTGTGISPAMDISHGSITAIGSVSVNGVNFDTSDAKIIVEGDEVGVGDLAVLEHLATGQVVTVEGQIQGSSGKATQVKFKSKVKGPVTDVKPVGVGMNTKQLVVLGQTVIIDDTTIYKKTTFDTVALNNFVDVSGFIDDMGVIHATHLKEKAEVFDPNEEVKVKGIVSNLDPAARIFRINALTVDYSSANDLSPDRLANGQFVEAKGTLDVNDVLIATKVELEDEIEAEDADRVEIEGFVTTFTSTTEFSVGNQPVMTNADTQFEGGEPFEIALGVKLEVEGALVNGVLVADEVSFRDNAKLKSIVDTIFVDPTDPLTGTLTLRGFGDVTIIVNELTKIKEGVKAFADIAIGDHVDVRGRAKTGTPTVTVTAREIKVKNESGEDKVKVELQGPIDDINEPLIKILGIEIDTSGVVEFEGLDDIEELTREQFFAMIMAGDVVEANGHLEGPTGSMINWKKIELEDDD